MADLCGHILTETEFRILTESGDALVTECFTSSLSPGRVYKGVYPYWVPRPRRRPRPLDHELDGEEIEELILMLVILNIF